MYKSNKILALIPARGGSKGIPYKNLIPLKGIPLLIRTINAANSSSLIDDIYCSTDDEKISNAATSTGLCKVVNRPSELATDTSKTIDAVLHALKHLHTAGKDYDYLLLLQPTSPLRQHEDIEGIIKYTIDNNLPSCISVSETHCIDRLLRNVSLKNNILIGKGLVSGSCTIRRQDAKKLYSVNGALYMYKISEILSKNRGVDFNDSPYVYITDPYASMDIDSIQDIKLSEFILDNFEIFKVKS